MVSGTMAAAVPMVVPTISLVNGMSATSRMMKGIERKALISAARTRLTAGRGQIPPVSVITSKRPSGKPKSSDKRPDTPTMTAVSPSADANSSKSSIDVSQHFDLCPMSFQNGEQGRLCVGAAVAHRKSHGTDRMSLDAIDFGVDDLRLPPRIGERSQHRRVLIEAGTADTQQGAARGRRLRPQRALQRLGQRRTHRAQQPPREF